MSVADRSSAMCSSGTFGSKEYAKFANAGHALAGADVMTSDGHANPRPLTDVLVNIWAPVHRDDANFVATVDPEPRRPAPVREPWREDHGAAARVMARRP